MMSPEKPHDRLAAPFGAPSGQLRRTPASHRHRAHRWMMLICAVAVALLVTGLASPGFVLAVVVCTATMATMLWAVSPPEH